MIFNTIKETVGGEETVVGMSFAAENDVEKDALKTWADYKSMATFGKDDGIINIVFTDIKAFLAEEEEDSDVGNND